MAKNYGSIFLDLTITNFFINAIGVIANFLKDQFSLFVDIELGTLLDKNKLLNFKYYIMIGFFIIFSIMCTIIYIESKNQLNKYDIIYVISMIFFVLLITILTFYLIIKFSIYLMKKKYIINN